jgi:hypothetical protein
MKIDNIRTETGAFAHACYCTVKKLITLGLVEKSS